MSSKPAPTVVNTHWYGSVETLPPNIKYIGRPSIWGNDYSSKSGRYTREQCVALHRIDQYRKLINQSTYLTRMRDELGGHDLACWCKQHKKLVACHGDNYLHILSDRLRYRQYDESLTFYLMDDLRFALSSIDTWIMKDSPQDNFLTFFIQFHDTKLVIQEALRLCRETFTDIETLSLLLGHLIVDLELAYNDPDLDMKDYRLRHALWIANTFIDRGVLQHVEPSLPHIPLKKRSKAKAQKDPANAKDHV